MLQIALLQVAMLAVCSSLHTDLSLMPTNPKRLSVENFITTNIIVNSEVGLLEGNLEVTA